MAVRDTSLERTTNPNLGVDDVVVDRSGDLWLTRPGEVVGTFDWGIYGGTYLVEGTVDVVTGDATSASDGADIDLIVAESGFVGRVDFLAGPNASVDIVNNGELGFIGRSGGDSGPMASDITFINNGTTSLGILWAENSLYVDNAGEMDSSFSLFLSAPTAVFRNKSKLNTSFQLNMLGETVEYINSGDTADPISSILTGSEIIFENSANMTDWSTRADFSSIKLFYVKDQGSATVKNSGYIESVFGFFRDFNGASVATAYVENSGTLALNAKSLGPIVFAEVDGHVVNSGEIHGKGAVIWSYGNSDAESTPRDPNLIVENSGRIELLGPSNPDPFGSPPFPDFAHAILASGGRDTVINTGTIIGEIALSKGGDRYDGTDGSLQGVLDGGGGWDVLLTGANDDTIFGRGGRDRIEAGAGDDLVKGGANNDTILGGDGADRLRGNRGDDVVDGGAGDDLVAGGRGDDTLTGGAGADRFFIWRATDSDTITDFEDGVDLIDLTALGLAPGTDVLPALSEAAGDAVLDLALLGGSGTVIVTGSAGLIDASDFLL